LSFLLLLNKNNNLLKQQDDAGRGSENPLLQEFWNGALPSNHEKLPPKPRVDFPQTTCRFPQTTSGFPSDHEWISLRPRVGFPQTTNQKTKTAYKWAEMRFAGDSGEAVVGTQRG
jgi:hypothetical protein